MPELPEPITENKFPDCIAMNLHLKAESPPRPLFSFFKRFNPSVPPPKPQELEVSLSVNFSSHQQINVPGGQHLGFSGGKVNFGVRQGSLVLEVNNCQLNWDEITLDRSFKILMEIETQQSGNLEKQNGRLTGHNSDAAILESTNGAPLQAHPKGDEEAAAKMFIFKAKGNGPLLGRALTETKLGRIQLMDLPCDIKASFKVRGEDIRLTWSKFGPSQKLTRNKIVLIERALALRYIKPQLEASSLSEVSWQYG